MVNNGYITSNLDLELVCALAKKAKIIALDTEFTRRTTYYPILSLIQIAFLDEAGAKKNFVIDCQLGLDLSGIFAIIADKKVVKVLHSAMQDLQIFYQESKILPQNIFDTQIMGNFCGCTFNAGYSKIVEDLFEVKLDKNQQDSDWQRRPLTIRQIEYAAMDVVYLEEIYNIFLEKIISTNRLEWLREEMEIFIQKSLFKKDETLFRDFSFKHKSDLEISQIKNLAIWREKWAQKNNVPRKHFIENEEIEKIVFNQRCSINFSKEILQEISQILSLDDVEKGEKEDDFFMSEKQKSIYKKAKEFIEEVAREEKLPSQILLTSLELRTIICRKNLFDKVIFGWRAKLLSQGLKEVINI
jgi:ribonuclease D